MWTGWAHHRSVGLVGGASCVRPVPTSCRGKPASFTKWGGAGGRGQIRREWGPGLGGKTQKSWAWGSEWNASLRTDIWLLRSLQGYLFWVPSPVGDAGACTLPLPSHPIQLDSTSFHHRPPPRPAASPTQETDTLPPRQDKAKILHTLGELWEVEASNYQLNLTFREFVGFTRLLHHKG